MLQFGQFIGNAFVASGSSDTIDVENPADQSVIGVVPAGCREDTEKALLLAKQAQPSWSQTPSSKRAELLKGIARIIRKNREELIDTLVKEQAKVVGLATIEIDVTADYFDYYAGLAFSYEGEILQSSNEKENIYLHYLPIGVSVGICPWNFPVFVMARKLAPALLAGCAVVVKVSEVTPLTSFLLMQHVEKAIGSGELEMPSGLVSVVTGYGNTIGNALCSSPIPGIISMTGSVATGMKIMETASKNMTKVSLELGGKAPAIVMDDANVDLAVDSIVSSRVIFSGQVCNCVERVYVHSSIYDEFLNKLVEKIKSSKVGTPDDESAACCSLMNKQHQEKVKGMVDRAVEAGAKIVCGGHVIEGPGYGYAPTVLVDAAQDSEIVQKEIFGPVLPVLKFETLDEAIMLANDCEYGLSSSIFTESYRNIEQARTEILFGEMYVNRFHFEAIQGFHAGWRKSGIGGADGKHGLMEYLQSKVVYVQR